MSSTRRTFLYGFLRTAGVVTLAACAGPTSPDVRTNSEESRPQSTTSGPDPLPDGLQRQHFHVHNERPLALETRRSQMGIGVITPLSRFFVRNNLPRPSESILDDRLAWILTVSGVARPGQIRLAELQQLGCETVTTVIQCSGNGRAFFDHGPSGSSWATGAAGCAMWTGVRVSDVLNHFGGPVQGTAFVTATGGESLPEGVERDAVVVERSIPLEKGMRDCFLVWEMNGEPLPLTHGGPLRLVVPGYYGCNQIKYIERLAATAGETTAKIQAKGYRFRPIGESGGADQPSLWRMPVKSWLHGVGADDLAILAGRRRLHGVALSGERGIQGVEYTVDNGETWLAAELSGPDLGPNAWRTFQCGVALPVGTTTVMTRATDTAGDVQPEAREENERGYRHTGWRDHALTVRVVAELTRGTPSDPPSVAGLATAEPPVERTLSAQAERGKTVFTETSSPPCGVCHSLADAGTQGAIGPNLDALAPSADQVQAAVTKGVGVMPAFDGLSAEQVSEVAAYIVEATR
ncbi:MAG: DMSO/TMAO reductase YedYZ molybdopterin-dependent catalytic subunit/cytochrome c553 [Myxococcota bacterium]|jgi:DMSO/TMAO reductase YedYZ molybdopterin-dependent catalytic subunit/cytochrome c553